MIKISSAATSKTATLLFFDFFCTILKTFVISLCIKVFFFL